MFSRFYLYGYRIRIPSNYLAHNVKKPFSRVNFSFLSNPQTCFYDLIKNNTFKTQSFIENKDLNNFTKINNLMNKLPKQYSLSTTDSLSLDESQDEQFQDLLNVNTKMEDNFVIARVPNEGDKLHLTIFWNNHKFKMERNKNETLGVTLGRMKLSLRKAELGKEFNQLIKNNPENLPEYSISFLTNLFKTFEEDSICQDAVLNSSFISINDNLLKLFTNVPQVDRVRLLPRAMVDCPVSLIVKDDADENFSDFSVEWLDSDGNLLSNDYVFIPSLSHLGVNFKARVTNNLMNYETSESNLVNVKLSPFCQWQLDRINNFNNAPKRVVDSPLQHQNYDVRVVSFNILSPTYVSSTDPSNFFIYCKPEYLDQDYRNLLIGREINYLNPDILCLQECSFKVYNEHLNYFMSKSYHSWITIKGGNSPEGCAMFVSLQNYETLEMLGLNFKDLVKSEEYKSKVNKIAKNWLTFHDNYFDKYYTIYQFGCYRVKSNGKYLFLANTHLYFHPMANHIRLLQTYLMLNELEKFKSTISQKYGFDIVNDSYTIICGDFNCIPNESVHQLMTKGYVSYDHPDWKLGETFVYDKNILTKEGYDRMKVLEQNKNQVFDQDKFLLVENYQGYTDSYLNEKIPFTNFCEMFNGTLDYIYHSNNIKAKRVMPGITQEEASEFIGLPSKLYPSDHLSIAADF